MIFLHRIRGESSILSNSSFFIGKSVDISGKFIEDSTKVFWPFERLLMYKNKRIQYMKISVIHQERLEGLIRHILDSNKTPAGIMKKMFFIDILYKTVILKNFIDNFCFKILF